MFSTFHLPEFIDLTDDPERQAELTAEMAQFGEYIVGKWAFLEGSMSDKIRGIAGHFDDRGDAFSFAEYVGGDVFTNPAKAVSA